MRNPRNGKKWLLIIACTCLGGFLMYLFIPTYSTLVRYGKEGEDLSVRIKDLRKENENLQIEINKLNNDPVYIEKMARKELGMMRQGEIMYKMTPDEKPQEETGKKE